MTGQHKRPPDAWPSLSASWFMISTCSLLKTNKNNRKAKPNKAEFSEVMGVSELLGAVWVKEEKESCVMGIQTPTEGAKAITENFLIVHLTFQHLLLWPAHIQ